MKKNIKKLAVLFIFGLAFYSCQKEDLRQETLTKEKEFFTPIGDNIKEGEFDIVPWGDQSTLKSSGSYNFIDGGMVMVGGQFMSTVIIGNQRWTTIDFKGLLNDPSFSKWDNLLYGTALSLDTTVYYSYNLAMTLNDSPTMMSYGPPAGLVETSTWRIPSWSDEQHLYQLASGDEEAISTALQYKTTGMVYHEYSSSHIPTADTISVYYNPATTVHWNSDYIPYDGTPGGASNGTYYFTGGNAVDHIYLFQFQLMMPYAPIRLVQNIEPLQ